MSGGASSFTAGVSSLDDLERMQLYEGDKMRGELQGCLERLRLLKLILKQRHLRGGQIENNRALPAPGAGRHRQLDSGRANRGR